MTPMQLVAVPCTVCVLTNWRENATKLYLFLDDIFQRSPVLFGVCVADNLFQSSHSNC